MDSLEEKETVISGDKYWWYIGESKGIGECGPSRKNTEPY